jgi:hypothetical protein
VLSVGVGVAWLAASMPSHAISGPTENVVATVADRIARESPRTGVILLGEDHHSPVPDAIGAALVDAMPFDCLLLELHQDLQPAVDQYAAGASWARTVKPAIRMFFGVEPLALGQDRRTLRASRKRHLGLHAVDKYPRELLNTLRWQAFYGLGVAPALRQQVIDDRDEAMVDRIEALHRSGTCRLSLYSVGWNHLPGMLRRLSERDVPAWGTIIEHRAPPPLASRLVVEWGDGRILVR